MTETVVSWRDAGRTRLMVVWVPCRGGVVLTFWGHGTARPVRLCVMVSVGSLQQLPAQVFHHSPSFCSNTHYSQNVHVFLFLSAILFFIHTQQKQFFVSFSVSRALGIPCRVVTNYLSAHDTNSNLAIEHYFNEKGEPDGTSRDMIWYKQMHYLPYYFPCMVSIFGYSANVQTASLSFLIIMDICDSVWSLKSQS